jgi:hypothetical protein
MYEKEYITGNLLLAFDLSSSTVGTAIFDIDTDELVNLSYFKYPEGEKDLLNKGRYLENYIENLFKKYSIDKDSLESIFSKSHIKYFVIEERLKKFQGGRSSADNILVLAQLNYICQYLMKFRFCIQPTEINVLKARGIIFPKIFKETRLTKQKQKDYIFEKVLEIVDKKYFFTKTMKSGPRKGENIYLEECKDMADSWVVGQAFLKNKYEYIKSTN